MHSSFVVETDGDGVVAAVDVGDREERRGTPLHQGTGPLRKRGKAVARNVMRDCERGSREAREKIAGKRFAWRERDRVEQAVERAPFALQRREQRVDVVVLG